MDLLRWSIRWGIPYAALHDLETQLGLHGGHDAPGDASEAAVQNLVRLEAARKGYKLFRNNVGALRDERGVPVRFGLANDTAKLNKVLKSGDLIGWRPRLITPADVGATLAQFVSREIKHPTWRYTGTEREVAQLAWATLVNAGGGDACFASGEGTL